MTWCSLVKSQLTFRKSIWPTSSESKSQPSKKQEEARNKQASTRLHSVTF
jgi:hypothetical protein